MPTCCWRQSRASPVLVLVLLLLLSPTFRATWTPAHMTPAITDRTFSFTGSYISSALSLQVGSNQADASYIYRSTDEGFTWDVLPAASTTATLLDVTAIHTTISGTTHTNVVAVGANVGNGGIIMCSSNSGTSFISVEVANLLIGVKMVLESADTMSAFAVGVNGAAYTATSADFAIWTQLDFTDSTGATIDATGSKFYSVSLFHSGPLNAIIVGDYGLVLSRKASASSYWTVNTLGGGTSAMITVAHSPQYANVAIVAGEGGHIYITYNHGSSWTSMTAGDASVFTYSSITYDTFKYHVVSMVRKILQSVPLFLRSHHHIN